MIMLSWITKIKLRTNGIWGHVRYRLPLHHVGPSSHVGAELRWGVAPAWALLAPLPYLLLWQPCRAPAASSPVRMLWMASHRGGCLADKAVVLIGSLGDILSSGQQQPKTKKAVPSLSLWCNRSNPHHPLPLRLHKQHPSAHHWQWQRSRWLDGRAASSTGVATGAAPGNSTAARREKRKDLPRLGMAATSTATESRATGRGRLRHESAKSAPARDRPRLMVS
jgi:hypothetical protein